MGTPDFLLELQMNSSQKPKKEIIGNAHTKRNIQKVFEQAATAHYRATTAILEATKRKRNLKPKKQKSEVDYAQENRDYYVSDMDKLADLKLKELKAQKRKRKQRQREEELGIRKYNNEFVQSLKDEIKKKSEDQKRQHKTREQVPKK